MGRYVIKPTEGSCRTRKRIGRGTGSGFGKTAGKGTKGQKSRSGYKQRAWFEGGQMPLQRRVPKRGFKNIFKVPYQVVNLKDLDRVKGEDINKEILEGVGLIRSAKKPVKLLGDGEIKRILNVTVDAFSVSARRAIEDAGGKCITLEIPRARIRPAEAAGTGKAPEAEQPAGEERAFEEEQPDETEPEDEAK